MNVSNKKCEACGLKFPIFGLPADGKARWCSGCATAHKGAENVVSKKCEGYQLKTLAGFGLPAGGSAVVLWVREGLQRSGERQQQEVRGLRPDCGVLRTAVG